MKENDKVAKIKDNIGLSFCVGSVCFCISMFMDAIGVGLFILAVCVLVGVALLIYLPYIKNNENKKEAIQHREDFYRECKTNGITDLSSPANRQRAEIIAQKHGCQYSSIDQFFAEMKAICDQKDAKEEEKKHREEIGALVTEERKKLQELTKYAAFSGRNKRVQMLADVANKYLEKIDGSVKGTDAIMRASQQKEHSWATHGGLASGIAGPAAGAAVAMDVQAKNAQIRAENKARMDALSPLILASMDRERKYRDIVEKLEKAIQEAELKLVADTPKEEVLSYLSFGVKKVTFSKTGAFTIDVEISMAKEAKIFENLDAVVDGTVAAHLYQNNAYVGTALLVLPVYGIDGKSATVNGIALCPSRADLPYEVRFTAHNLWLMEKQKYTPSL